MVDAQGNAYYFLKDGLGSVRGIVDASGTLTATYSYNAYGNLRSSTGTLPNAFRYTGEWFDAETGLYYLRARYYDPAVGRFITRDPWPGVLTRPYSQNPYLYVENNPVLYVDPTGKWVWVVVGGVVGGVVGFGSYALTHRDNFNWGEALLWTGGGVVAGTGLGALYEWLAAGGLATISAAAGGTAGAVSSQCSSRTGQTYQVTFGHGSRHLVGTGLTRSEVEAAIAQAIRDSVKVASSVGNFWGRVVVRGRVIEYRAYTVDATKINVGTYYPVER